MTTSVVARAVADSVSPLATITSLVAAPASLHVANRLEALPADIAHWSAEAQRLGRAWHQVSWQDFSPAEVKAVETEYLKDMAALRQRGSFSAERYQTMVHPANIQVQTGFRLFGRRQNQIEAQESAAWRPPRCGSTHSRQCSRVTKGVVAWPRQTVSAVVRRRD